MSLRSRVVARARQILAAPPVENEESIVNRFISTNLRNNPQFNILFMDQFKIITQRQPGENFADYLRNGRSSDAVNLLERLKDIDAAGKVAIDVGANMGIVTTFLSRRYDRVHAFEPSSDNRKLFQRTIELNDVHNVHLHPLALSDVVGTATLHIASGHGHHSLEDVRTTPKISEEVVRTTTLDGFLDQEKIERVNLLKIDTEGFELEVLRGSQRALSSSRFDLIVFEIAPSILKKRQISSSSIFEMLQAYGYASYDLVGNKVQSDCACPHGDYIATLAADPL